MAAPKVRIDVEANAIGFFRTMSGVKNEMTHLVGLSNGLKNAIVGALGGATLTGIVTHMLDFAKSLDDVSKNMGITIERAYELKKAALEAGKEVNVFDKIHTKISTFMSELAGGKHSSTANALGLVGNENWNQALIKALTATRGMSRAQAFTYMREFAGPRSEWMLEPKTREAIIKSGGSGLDVDAVRKMAEFKLELELLTLEIEKHLLPAFSQLAGWVLRFIDRFGAGWGRRTAAHEYAMQMRGENILGGNLAEAMIRAGIPGFHKLFEDREYGRIYDEFMNRENNIAAEKDKEMQQERARRKAAFYAEQKAIENAPGNWTAMNQQRIHWGTNAFLKIGGMMGTDTALRLERLQQQANSYLADIADTLHSLVQPQQVTSSPMSPFAVFTPLAPSPARVPSQSGWGKAGPMGASSQNAPVFNPPAVHTAPAPPMPAPSRFKRNIAP